VLLRYPALSVLHLGCGWVVAEVFLGCNWGAPGVPLVCLGCAWGAPGVCLGIRLEDLENQSQQEIEARINSSWYPVLLRDGRKSQLPEEGPLLTVSGPRLVLTGSVTLSQWKHQGPAPARSHLPGPVPSRQLRAPPRPALIHHLFQLTSYRTFGVLGRCYLALPSCGLCQYPSSLIALLTSPF